MQKILVLFISISFTLFSQNPWEGLSVSMPDNLNAISDNPAGLGLNRGSQSGTYIPIDSTLSIFSAFRSNGFGYNLKYSSNNINLLNPNDGNIGIGFALNTNLYAGFKWNKFNITDIGFLYRPINQISLGAVSQLDNTFKHNHTILGFSIRPLFKHRLSIGADIKILSSDEFTYAPHFQIQPFNGISFSIKTNQDIDEFKFNLNLNLGKFSIYSPSAYSSDGNISGGIGFYSSSQKQKTILKKASKDAEKFVRMKLNGLFIEEKPIEPPLNFNIDISPFSQKKEKGIQLRAWIDKMDKLTNDKSIAGLIIDIKNVRAGFAKRGEIYSALERFKKAGKKIYAYAEMGISNSDYHLISMADKIYLNEYTGINLRGLKIEVQFFRGLLDTLLITPEVFRVEYDGKSYKTAGDQFLNKKMSKEMRENYGDMIDDFYQTFVRDISNGRKWDKNKTQNIIDNGPYFEPQDAIAAGLADSIMYPDQFETYLDSLNKGKVNILKWENIDNSNKYVHQWAPKKKDKIAIIYAVGGIVSGKSNPGPTGSSQMGDKTISKSIKAARKDKDIKAILLRIDSGGGSALASDQMWREIYKTTDEDTTNTKPFIASMSDVAASGGYYIACQADTIIAHESTVTGSIGVIGVQLNISKLLKKWGISSDIIKKGKFSDFGSTNRLTSNKEKEKIQSSINNVYETFKDRIISGRNLDVSNSDLDEIAMGRVFTGKRAKANISIPLVDINGGLHDAIEVTKKAAGLEGKEIEIVEYPKKSDSFIDISKSINTSISINYSDLLPQQLLESVEVLDILPILIDNEIQIILPYKITIE